MNTPRKSVLFRAPTRNIASRNIFGSNSSDIVLSERHRKLHFLEHIFSQSVLFRTRLDIRNISPPFPRTSRASRLPDARLVLGDSRTLASADQCSGIDARSRARVGRIFSKFLPRLVVSDRHRAPSRKLARPGLETLHRNPRAIPSLGLHIFDR